MTPSSRTLYLARHGETEWNRVGRWQGRTDVPLNDTGRAQALELARRLEGRGIASVMSSDLVRARETGQIVADHIGVPFSGVDPALRERGFGVFEGLTREECEAQQPEAWARYRIDPSKSPANAEPHEEVVLRMREATLRISRIITDPGRPVLIVGHGGALRALLGAVTGVPRPPIANASVFRLMLLGECWEDGVSLDEVS